jgi:hypothetical protein
MTSSKHLNTDKHLPFLQRLNSVDWLYAIVLAVSALFAFKQYAEFMDIYEISFLFGAVILFSVLGWSWKPVRLLVVSVAAVSVFSTTLYHADLARIDQV